MNERYQKFAEEIENLSGKAFLVRKEEISSKLQTILTEDTQEIIIYQTSLIEQMIPTTFGQEAANLSVHWLPSVRPKDFNSNEYRKLMIEADIGIIAADYLLADSGTAVILGKHNGNHMVSLLPPMLIVLAAAQQIVQDVFELHAIFRESNQEHESTLQYITGPSRTTDIEKTLILGVHGPKELCVLVISEE